MARRSTAASLPQRLLSEVLAQVPVPDCHRAGLGPCVGCAMAPFETVAEAAKILGLDPARVTARLATALRRKAAR